MPIVKIGPQKRGGSPRHKQRCWECGQAASAFVVSPSSGNPLCPQCGEKYFKGVIEVVKRAKAPDA